MVVGRVPVLVVGRCDVCHSTQRDLPLLILQGFRVLSLPEYSRKLFREDRQPSVALSGPLPGERVAGLFAGQSDRHWMGSLPRLKPNSISTTYLEAKSPHLLKNRNSSVTR